MKMVGGKWSSWSGGVFSQPPEMFAPNDAIARSSLTGAGRTMLLRRAGASVVRVSGGGPPRGAWGVGGEIAGRARPPYNPTGRFFLGPREALFEQLDALVRATRHFEFFCFPY